MMRRVLMVSPHFPPDNSAGTHRVRLLAPHLERLGWDPVVVTVDPRDYEGERDEALLELVPRKLRVVRCRAWPARWTRRFGFGDLGLRALGHLYRTCRELLRRERFDALFVTIFPAYPALLGPLLKRQFGIPFVLDYQDPWVGAWGKTVGAGPGGRPDLRSKLARWAGEILEPYAVRAADAVVAVSGGLCRQLQRRFLFLESRCCAAIPVGGEPADYEYLRAHPRPNGYFDVADGCLHLCATGTLLPMGVVTVEALLEAVREIRAAEPEASRRLRLHFFGTSNQCSRNARPRVSPLARARGVGDLVSEVPGRIGYLDALTVQSQASAILLLGSDEPHYTPSKLYPALLARRPVLAAYHEASSAVSLLRPLAHPPEVQLITYSESTPVAQRAAAFTEAVRELLRARRLEAPRWPEEVVARFSARTQAARLAEVLDRVCHG